MPLHTTEAAQCPTCEEYSRLGELVNVKREKDGSVKVTRKDERGGYIGNCPHCGWRICQNDVC